MIVTVEQLKEHLVIEDDIDDNYLLSLLSTAEDAVYKNLNITDDVEASPSVIQSILVLAGTLYANRESVAYSNVSAVPHTFDYLISLNKNYDDSTGRV